MQVSESPSPPEAEAKLRVARHRFRLQTPDLRSSADVATARSPYRETCNGGSETGSGRGTKGGVTIFYLDAIKTIALDRQRELIRAEDEWRLVRGARTSETGKVRAQRHRWITRFAPLRRGEAA